MEKISDTMVESLGYPTGLETKLDESVSVFTGLELDSEYPSGLDEQDGKEGKTCHTCNKGTFKKIVKDGKEKLGCDHCGKLNESVSVFTGLELDSEYPSGLEEKEIYFYKGKKVTMVERPVGSRKTTDKDFIEIYDEETGDMKLVKKSELFAGVIPATGGKITAGYFASKTDAGFLNAKEATKGVKEGKLIGPFKSLSAAERASLKHWKRRS